MFARVWSNAWLLLALANLFWAGNVVVGRAVSADIPPLAFTLARWGGAFCLVIWIALPHLARDLPILFQQWRRITVMAVCGFAAFNTMSYRGMRETTALNALMMQSAMPMIVLLWMVALYGERPRAAQIVGVVISIAGVAAIACHGDPATLVSMSLNPGDVWILSALGFYALYAAMLRRRPAVHPASFLAATFAVATIFLLPLAGLEYASGARIHGGVPSALAIVYTATLPSFVSTLFFNRGVELIGPGRAGQSAHLIPVFGSMLAVIFLGETFRFYHLAGIALIGAGIFMASWQRSPAKLAGEPVPTLERENA